MKHSRFIKTLLALLLGGTVLLGVTNAPVGPAVWRNSLGMDFVPIPVRAREVRMAVVETQEAQMRTFRKERNIAQSAKVGFFASKTPAAYVDWYEAVAFCEWLTQKERAAGRISAQARYRLPTDHEWSCAVGIGEHEAVKGTPEDKSNRIGDLHPWGSAWPPPDGAGNLCGEESQSDFPDCYIQGYRDGLAGGKLRSRASAANALGLHDLAGSLWEWCEDPFRADKEDWRVLRGGSWKSMNRQTLLSSHRTHDPRGYRSDSVGFRCVLEGR